MNSGSPARLLSLPFQMTSSISYLSHCRDVWMQSSKLVGVIHDINSFSQGTMTLCSDVIGACLCLQNKVSFLQYIIFVCDKTFVQARSDLSVLTKRQNSVNDAQLHLGTISTIQRPPPPTQATSDSNRPTTSQVTTCRPHNLDKRQDVRQGLHITISPPAVSQQNCQLLHILQIVLFLSMLCLLHTVVESN